MIGIAAVATLAAGCGNDEPAAAPPQANAQTGAPAVSQQAAPAWENADPCTALRPDELTLYLKTTPANPTRADDGGKHVCVFGDGEFRGVWLTLWKPADAAEVSGFGTRDVTVAGKKGRVDDQDYSCEIVLGDAQAAVSLHTVSMDQAKWCDQTEKTLTAVLPRVGW